MYCKIVIYFQYKDMSLGTTLTILFWYNFLFLSYWAAFLFNSLKLLYNLNKYVLPVYLQWSPSKLVKLYFGMKLAHTSPFLKHSIV